MDGVPETAVTQEKDLKIRDSEAYPREQIEVSYIVNNGSFQWNIA